MASYLSESWFEEVRAAVAAATPPVVAGDGVTLQQVVTGGPDGEVRYWLRVAEGAASVERGDAERPDATVTSSYETAAAVHQRQRSVEQAFLAGELRLAGDLAVLVAHQAALAGLDAAVDAVRARTTYAV
ncbi:MAG: SCP2 sterol-binding domain-containing protein [Acidimicrobiales bacterium]